MSMSMVTRWLALTGMVLAGLGACKTEPSMAPESGGSPGSLPAAVAQIQGEEVTYQADGVALKGYIAWDAAKKGRRPGVLVVHEWWGHNDYARMRARMLAELGYTALAVDMYGEGRQAAHPGDAQKFMMEVTANMEVAVKRFVAAKAVLDAHPTTDAAKIAAIGYCFGGAIVLHMARTGMDLAGVVSFHGNLSTKTPAQEGVLKARLLVAHGGEDPFVPPAQVAAFKEEMKAAGADLRFFAFPGAKHAFTNPGATEMGKKFELPLAYDAAADQQSWQELQKFLGEIFAA